MSKYGVLWDRCVLLGLHNTSVNVGCYDSVIIEARNKNKNIIFMGCPCQSYHPQCHKKVTEALSKINHSGVEKLLVDIYFHFKYSFKPKNIFAKCCDFCDQDYRKNLKFHNVCWLGIAICIEKVINLPSLHGSLWKPMERMEWNP